MFKVVQKLKFCKYSFIQWRKEHKHNARREIDLIQREMEIMQQLGGDRNWDRWRQLKESLDAAYQAEEEFW